MSAGVGPVFSVVLVIVQVCYLEDISQPRPTDNRFRFCDYTTGEKLN